MTIYKGYLKGNGKHAATSFKDGSKLLSYNTARKEDSNVGIHCDYKLGIKNTADPLKINGKVRKWLRKFEEHDPMPAWLYPYNKKNPNLTKLSDGDGRNDKLFTYILKMQSQGIAKKNIKETISIINNYILEEPVEKNELNIILRDDAFMKESFFIKGVFHHDKFGDFLINEHHICKIANVLHIYHDGVYSDREEDIERMMVKHISSLTRARRQETLAYIQLNAKEKQFASTQYIVMKNGVFNLETWQLEDFSPEIITRNKIPIAYVPGAYYEVTDRTFNRTAVHDKKIRSILEEILGYILFRRNEFAAMFVLTSNGSNGKSSYLKIIRKLVGEFNTASLDLKELDQRFKTAELFGKLVNIGDDISKSYIKESSVLKKLATGETLNVERKGKDPFDFTNYAKLIFSANEMPRINDYTDGLGRRLQIVPFKAKFSVDDDDYDPFITDKLLSDESMHYVLNLALNALKRLLNNKKFHTIQSC